MSAIEELRSGIPDYAKDLKLNLQSVLTQSSLDEAQVWSVAAATAIATRNAGLREAVLADAKEKLSPEQLDDARMAAVARAECERLSALPRELVTVTSLIEERRLFEAEQLCRDFLKRSPHHVEAMRLLAQLGVRLFVYDDAEFLLDGELQVMPRHGLVHR